MLVPELQIDFGAGFNTVTGETGAGKSLVIGALQLLSGGRASASAIRRGASGCEVAAVLHLPPEYPGVRGWLAAKLDECALPPCEEWRILLRRVITAGGSRAFINGSPVTAALLKTVGERLIDIHGANENQSLLQPSQQLRLVDLYGGHREKLLAVGGVWQRLQQIRKQRQELEDDALSPEEVELFSHQLREIDRARLSPGEESQLIARHRTAANCARLQELSGQLAMELSMGEDALTERLAPVIRSCEELAELDGEKGDGFVARLNAISEELSSLAEDLQGYGAGLELDAEALQTMEERLSLIQRLKRRFGSTLEEVLAAAERLRARVSRAQGRSEQLSRLQEEEDQCWRQLAEACGELSRLRRRTAEALSPAINAKLRRLGFADAHFEVRLAQSPPSASGADSCEFFFAPNRGEECTALRHSASSGEVARVMLAIKTVLSEVDEVPVLVFDEIDANIGGRTALAVAEELRSVGGRHQVFSITHLPLIAAAGNQQYMVEKHADGDRTVTAMRRLDGEERVAEIVRMLGASAADRAAVGHAREMLADFGK